MKNIFLIPITLLFVASSCINSKPKIKGLTIKEEDSFNFLVVGDWGRDGDYHQKDVAVQMDKTSKIIDPEFVISTGDNFYDAGVASIDDPIWQRSFEDIYVGGGLSKEWFAVLGNHDYKGNPQAQIDYSKKSRRWKMPARYFTFSRKIDSKNKVCFVFLDTSPFVEKYKKEPEKYSDIMLQDTQKQLQWLDSVLVSNKDNIKIVVGHHPIYSTGQSHGDTPELIKNLKPILEKHKITAYLCGHDHDLQHQKPTDSDIEYFVSGAGSDVRKGVSFRPYTKFAKPIQGFAAVSLSEMTLKLQFINYKGKVIYTYSKDLQSKSITKAKE